MVKNMRNRSESLLNKDQDFKFKGSKYHAISSASASIKCKFKNN